jgi:hypothetical protein
LPPLGELVADEPSWHYPPATTAGEGAALVPLEYSIEWLTCAVASRLDAVMVG